MLLKYFVIIFLSSLAIANPKDDRCWTSESNPATLTPYTSQAEWRNDLTKWQRLKPPQASLIHLAKAYAVVYKSEKAKAASFSNDKLAHCYVGCRLTQETNFRTSRFIGWLKEDFDLTDCKMSSHFDPVDYQATVFGSEAGKDKKINCETVCLILIQSLNSL